jgi:hypothetical protein
MRPRVPFPVRPFDTAPDEVVDAAKRLFSRRGEFNGRETGRLADRYHLSSDRIDGQTAVDLLR